MTNLVARYDAARLGLLRTSRRDVLRFSVGAGLGAVLLPLLAACGSSKSSTPTATTASGAAGATMKATLTDTRIMLSPASVKAGSIIVTAINTGSMEHELFFIKTDAAEGSLKVEPATGEVDEAAAGESPGEINKIAAGETKSGTFQLTAGHYVLICNVAGHYALGMHAALVVT